MEFFTLDKFMHSLGFRDEPTSNGEFIIYYMNAGRCNNSDYGNLCIDHAGKAFQTYTNIVSFSHKIFTGEHDTFEELKGAKVKSIFPRMVGAIEDYLYYVNNGVL